MPHSRNSGRSDASGHCFHAALFPTFFESLLPALAPFREEVVVGVECMFGWYWVADAAPSTTSPASSVTPCT